MLLNCSSTRALVAWAPDAHATSFSVSATTAGAAPANCSSSSSSSCVLDGLSCGRRYVGEAVALGDRCPSAPSTSFEILTGALKALLFECINFVQNGEKRAEVWGIEIGQIET